MGFLTFTPRNGNHFPRFVHPLSRRGGNYLIEFGFILFSCFRYHFLPFLLITHFPCTHMLAERRYAENRLKFRNSPHEVVVIVFVVFSFLYTAKHRERVDTVNGSSALSFHSCLVSTKLSSTENSSSARNAIFFQFLHRHTFLIISKTECKFPRHFISRLYSMLHQRITTRKDYHHFILLFISWTFKLHLERKHGSWTSLA